MPQCGPKRANKTKQNKTVYPSQKYCTLEEKNPKEERNCVSNTMATKNPSTLILTSTSSRLERMVKEEQDWRELRSFLILWCALNLCRTLELRWLMFSLRCPQQWPSSIVLIGRFSTWEHWSVLRHTKSFHEGKCEFMLTMDPGP